MSVCCSSSHRPSSRSFTLRHSAIQPPFCERSNEWREVSASRRERGAKRWRDGGRDRGRVTDHPARPYHFHLTALFHSRSLAFRSPPATFSHIRAWFLLPASLEVSFSVDLSFASISVYQLNVLLIVLRCLLSSFRSNLFFFFSIWILTMNSWEIMEGILA